MAFRFQKRIKLAPGIRVNLSKGGVSLGIGIPGASINVGAKGLRKTAGIPGTGLSWSKVNSWSGNSGVNPAEELDALGKEVISLADKFNNLSPKVNKQVEAWNKAVNSFSGGRGPSQSKFVTLTKRHGSAADKIDGIVATTEEQIAYLSAISQRIEGLSFGFFGGSAKRQRNDLLNNIKSFKSEAYKLVQQIGEIQKEVNLELESLGI